jgi:alpha-tubulin suppressor-like RCC1 family protein
MAKLLPAGLVALLLVLGAHPAVADDPLPPDEPPPSTADWTTVSTGDRHACAIRTNGRLYCWGDDGHGQLGNGGTNEDATIPIEVAGDFTDWVGLSAGGDHTCARRGAGRLYCWGSDADGELGEGPGTADQPEPVQVTGAHVDWRAVDSGASHTCARRADGRLRCFGADAGGQLGEGPGTADQQSPVLVTGGATTWRGIGAGDQHTCATRANGRLFCWGVDASGQLGEGPGTGTRQGPVQVTSGADNWSAITAGRSHSCGRRTTDRLFCWGTSISGELGSVPGGDRQQPVEVTGGVTTWGAAAAGPGATCARRASGRLYCWGLSLRPSAEPERIGTESDWTVVDVGGTFTCGRRSTGQLFCWGMSDDGELGNGELADVQYDPVEVAGPQD